MSILEEIKQPIQSEFVEFQQAFQTVFETENMLLSEVFEHLTQKLGKQMRPIILLLAAKLTGGVVDKSIQSAVALELLHTASLLHDDVVDAADCRRGQPTVNATWGNKVAVLAGDYMLSKSLDVIASTGQLRIISAFSLTGQNLSEGELLQLANSRAMAQTEGDYFSVIKNKTAKLFAVCTEVGALSVGASDELVERMRQFGELLGICFQLKDDLLDYTPKALIGKPTMHDVRDGKITLPLLHALQNAAQTEVEEVLVVIREKNFTDENLQMLHEFVASHHGLRYTQERMAAYQSQAAALLSAFPASPTRRSLQLLLDYTTQRDH